ncbi:MAG TPA: alkene reductase, partial [Paraburkholderia sp.]|nr:alkene reductase [Paraburkholderia sp.]
GYAYTPGIYTDAHVEAWAAVTEAVHEAGGRIALQLWHVGRMSHVSLQESGAAPVAPSAIQAGDEIFTVDGPAAPSMPRALLTEEIPGIIEDYRHAAGRAKDAGFDGVEIHAANCYLLEQFIRDSTNKRTDRYGGSVENRTRLAIEVIETVTDVWGADRVGVRLSPITRAVGDTPLDSNPQATYGYLVERVGKLGLAWLHCVEGQTRGKNAARDFDFKALHAAFGGKYIANNSYDRTLAIEAIRSGYADMVAFGRPFIGTPDLVERLRLDLPWTDAPVESYYGGGAKGYIDFQPFTEA